MVAPTIMFAGATLMLIGYGLFAVGAASVFLKLW